MPTSVSRALRRTLGTHDESPAGRLMPDSKTLSPRPVYSAGQESVSGAPLKTATSREEKIQAMYDQLEGCDAVGVSRMQQWTDCRTRIGQHGKKRSGE